MSFYVEGSKLAWSPFGSVKIYGFGNFFWKNLISRFDTFRTFKSCEGEDRVSHACTFKKSSKTRVRVHTSYGTGNIVKVLSASDVTVFEILTFGPIGKNKN
jgi:hypothetical protein